MAALYNDSNGFVASWLKNLSVRGLIAPGKVLSCSIQDIPPGVPDGFTQCHWFAGIGAWSYALRLAGWPDGRSVWTASLPCQPYSVIGKGAGDSDERNLWGEFRKLLVRHMPPVIFGEQVASPAGRDWLDNVSSDMEALGYAVGAADLCAAGIGAPHIRQRLFWVARNIRSRNRMGHPGSSRLQRHSGNVGSRSKPGRKYSDAAGFTPPAGSLGGFWADHPAWVPGADGKWRPFECGSPPLVARPSRYMERMRAYGNSIVAPLAAEFIRAFMDTE